MVQLLYFSAASIQLLITLASSIVYLKLQALSGSSILDLYVNPFWGSKMVRKDLILWPCSTSCYCTVFMHLSWAVDTLVSGGCWILSAFTIIVEKWWNLHFWNRSCLLKRMLHLSLLSFCFLPQFKSGGAGSQFHNAHQFRNKMAGCYLSQIRVLHKIDSNLCILDNK